MSVKGAGVTQIVSVDEAKERLDALIDAVIEGNEVVIISSDQRSIRLVPAEAVHSPRKRKFGSAAGLIRAADDFDAPLPDFEGYQ